MGLHQRATEKLSKEEVTILSAIVSLALQLPEELHTYTGAIGELRRHFLRGRTRQRRRGGFAQSRTVSATKRYGS